MKLKRIIIIVLICFLFNHTIFTNTIVSAAGPTMDFTAWEEKDPSTKITNTSTTLTCQLTNDLDDTYVYYDFGVDYFSYSFSANLEVNITAASTEYGQAPFLTFANNLGDIQAVSEQIYCYAYRSGAVGNPYYFYIANNLTGSSSTFPVNSGTTYYLTFTRSGTNGSICNLTAYTNSARTTYYNGTTITNCNTDKFRYCMAVQSNDVGAATQYIYHTVANLTFNTLFVTTNTTTGIEENNATINGYLYDDGIDGDPYVLYENYTSGDNTAVVTYGSGWDAQTFTPEISHNISFVKIKTYRNNNPGTITVAIKAVDGDGKPTGFDLSTGTANGNLLTNSPPGEWLEINMSSYPLIAGTKYAFIVKVLSGDSSNSIDIRADSTSPTYTNGSYVYSTDSGTIWTVYNSYDLLFGEGSSCTVNFEYGTTTSYGTNTSTQIKSAGDLFSNNISGLLAGQLYHYRAKARNILTSANGTDMTFLTKPENPTSFTASSTSAYSNSLSWIKGLGANNTYIERNTSSTWERGNGTLIYNNTAGSLNNNNCTAGQLYYYTSWSYTSWDTYNYFSDNSTSAYDLVKPEAPTNSLFTFINSTSLNISWTKGTGANRTVIVSKNTGLPSSVSDGTIIYNGTSNFSVQTISQNTNYYIRVWSYTNWSNPSLFQFSSNYTDFSIGGGIFINCYDASNNTNLTFNVTITNLSGTQTYNNNSVTNTHSINASLCPQGEVIIIISAINYSSATYRLNIQNSIVYTLDAYLNHINKTYLYRLIINNEKNIGEKNVYVEIKQQINVSSFQTITNTTTDSSGYVYIWLDAEELYIVTLSKTGFQTDSDQFIPSTSVFEYTFVIEYIDIVIPPEYIEYEQIVFTATRSGTTITIQYQDKLSQTINTTIYVYSENATTKTRSLISTTLNTSTNTITLYVTVNQYNSHIIVLFYNHTTFHSMSRTITVMGVTVPISSINKIDTLLPLIIGSNPFGWGNFLMFLFLLAGCYYADERDVGKILVLLGGMFLFINVWLGFNTTLLTVAGGAIPVLFIVVGLLVIWGDSNKR